MNIERVKRLLKSKENIRLEFKLATNALPKNLFESICAMLNRNGGDIILGVSDKNIVAGVDKNVLSQMVTDLVNLSNNPSKINPPFILFPQVYEIAKKQIIHIQVPESSQVHNTNNIVYDRSNDGDFKVTSASQIAALHNRKKTHYTENIIYPALKFTDFKKELFPKIRNLIRSNYTNHPWLALTDKQLLENAGLYKQDFKTGEQGYTLAAALLLGKDKVIQQILPHYKIDALVRIKNLLRYDDREYIETNLIEAYDKLLDFVAKHLPDKFYMEGDQRVSLRTKIFREVVANLIVHREYTSAHPASFIIYNNRVETKNANNPNGDGAINPKSFSPFSKNPCIAKFFMQLGRVDELGSGVINVNRLVSEYGGKGKPQFVEGDVFKMIIPIDEKLFREINDGVSDGISDAVNVAVNDAVKRKLIDAVSDAVNDTLIDAVKTIIADNTGVSINEVMSKTGKSNATVKRYLQILKTLDLIEFKGASKTGKYFITDRLKSKLNKAR